jgi:hypothetical protein
MSVLSLLSGAVLIGLVYGLSFVPSATLSRPDDMELGLADDDAAKRDPDAADADADPDRRERDTV